MKIRKLHKLLLFVFFLFVLNGCDAYNITSPIQETTTEAQTTEDSTASTNYQETTETDLSVQLRSIYELALEADAFDGTYEEWLETVRGPQGVPGEDGREFILRVNNEYLQWQYTGDTTWMNLIDLNSLAGVDGIGIRLIDVNESGELIITMTDSSIINLGHIISTYTIQFKDYNGYLMDVQIVEYQGEAIPPTIMQRDGYDFIGWDQDTSVVTSDMEVFAQYNIHKFEVIFETEGILEQSRISNISYGTTITLPTPTLEGYYFAGWFLGESEYAERIYSTSPVTQDMTLYARWEQEIHKVKFYNDNNLIYVEYVINGASANAPTPPIKAGYLFTGWDIEYTNVTTNLVVTATYSIETYSVSFDSQGGSSCSDLIDISHGSTIELPIPVKEGFIFAGWYRSNLITASSFYDDDLVISNLVLYARWDAQDYRIQFVDDNESILSTQYIRYQETVVQPANPIRLGYSFLGWYEDQACTKLYDFTTYPTSDILIYAQWELDVYQIEYILSEGTNAMDTLTSYTVHSETFELLPATRIGYDFDGWYTNSTYTGEPLVEIVTGSTGDLTLYAKWSLIEYTITYELNGGNLDQENTVTYTILDDLFFFLPIPTKDGYEFVGWYLSSELEGDMANAFNSTLYQGDITFYAKWELAVLNVIYYLDGGTNNIDNPTNFTVLSESLELFDATRSGCNFLGWYVDGEFSGLPTSEIPSGTSQSLYLYAKWEVLNFNIYYVLDEGINSEDNLESYDANLETVILSDPEREGYSFLGWYDNSMFENEPISSFESSLGTDITLYAKWEITNYDIFYNLDDGTNDPLNPTSFTLFSETFELLDAIKEGYTFLGWYANDEFEGNSITEVTTGSNYSLVLYAKWEITYYEVIYHLYDGYYSYDPSHFTAYDPDIYIYEPYKPGYAFLGWYDNSEFIGEGVNVWVIYSGTSQSVELHAKWELIDYNIDYVLDGGTNNIDNLTTYNVQMENIILYDPVLEGHVFEGWYYNQLCEGMNIILWTVNTIIPEDITLYACWSLEP